MPFLPPNQQCQSTEGILCHARLMQLMLLTPAEQVCQHNTARSCWSRHASTSARVDIACQRGHSSKPAVCRCCGAQWHRQTDGQTPYRCIDPAAYYADIDNNWRRAMQSVPRHRPMLLVTCDHYVKLDLSSRHIGTIITRMSRTAYK